MEPTLIQINRSYFLGILSALILMAWYGRGRLGGTETSIEWIKETVKKFEGKVDEIYGSVFPIKLLSRGVKILEESGLKEYVEKPRADRFKMPRPRRCKCV